MVLTTIEARNRGALHVVAKKPGEPAGIPSRPPTRNNGSPMVVDVIFRKWCGPLQKMPGGWCEANSSPSPSIPPTSQAQNCSENLETTKPTLSHQSEKSPEKHYLSKCCVSCIPL
jgi:hypothetical protein